MKTIIILSISFIVSFIMQSAEGSAVGMEPTFYPKLNEQFQLRFHETASITNGPQITLLNIDDSRCPSDVTCVWEGEVKILLNVVKDWQDLGNFTLTSRAGNKDLATQTVDKYSIQVMQVDPYPVSTRNISSSDYVVTLIVSDTKNTLSPLKQFKSGIPAQAIKCKQDLQLVIKAKDGSPACVKPSSVSKLLVRGWGYDISVTSQPIPEEPASSIKDKDSASIQGTPGKPETLIETVPASSGSIMNFYINDDDLNTSHNGIDVIPTTGLLEFAINGISIQGPETMTETGPNTGRFFVTLELPDTINGRPLTQDDILEIRYLDQANAAGEKSSSAKSIPLTNAYAKVQTSGAGQTRIGHEFTVRIYEPDFNLDSKDVDRIPLSRLEYRGEGGIRTTLANPAFDANSSFLLETGDNTGIFQVIIKIPRTIDGKTVHIRDWYEIRYIDTSTPSNTNEEIKLKGRIG